MPAPTTLARAPRSNASTSSIERAASGPCHPRTSTTTNRTAPTFRLRPDKMEWIDFKLELHGDPEGIDRPLVRAWWDGTGFVGGCPSCGGRIRFTTLGMTPASEDGSAGPFPRLPENWAEVAQFA